MRDLKYFDIIVFVFAYKWSANSTTVSYTVVTYKKTVVPDVSPTWTTQIISKPTQLTSGMDTSGYTNQTIDRNK